MPLPAKQQVGSYPQGINQIPYASYMRITKYTYLEGLAQVGKNQKDAIGLLGNGNPTVLGILGKINEEVERIFNQNATVQTTIPSPAPPFSFPLPGSMYGPQPLPANLDPNVKTKIISQRRRRQTARSAANSNPQSVVLAMPNEFQYEYGANWNNTFKLGTLAMLAEDPKKAAGLTGAAGTIMGLIGAATGAANVPGAAANAAQAAGAGARFALDPFNITNISTTNIIGLAGLAPNENAIQFFKNMDFRSFTLNFELASRNSTESALVDFMINFFKVGMHPRSLSTSGVGGVLGFPSVFTLEPMFNEVTQSTGAVKPKNHPQMPKTKLCGLTNLKINTTPFNTLTTVFDGSIPLVTMQLTFTELTALTSEDFTGGGGGF